MTEVGAQGRTAVTTEVLPSRVPPARGDTTTSSGLP